MSPERWTFGSVDFDSGNPWAQEFFLERVDELVPEVLDDLRNNVLPMARKPDKSAEEEALRKWAEKWNLTDQWLLKSARSTMTVWLREADLERGWVHRPGSMSHGSPIQPEFEYSGWTYHPFIHRRKAFKKSILGEVEEALEAYMDQVEEAVTEEGDFRRSAPKWQQKDHFDWLVFYQVDGLSYSKVAERVSRSRSTVTSAIKDVADLINLTLRPPDSGGRPPGS